MAQRTAVRTPRSPVTTDVDQIPWGVDTLSFHVKECETFVPMPRQKSGTDVKHLRCFCGEKLHYHHDLKDKQGQIRVDVLNHLLRDLPDDMKSICSLEKWENNIPDPFPDLTNYWTGRFKKMRTNSCGRVNFSSTPNTKPAKFLRFSDEDSVTDIWDFIKKKWNILDPKPDLVISVVGGAKNFRLEGAKRTKFEDGLLKIAETTQSVFLTSGFHVGTMKAVGVIMKHGQSYNIQNNKVKHSITCIGIGPWGLVKNRNALEELSNHCEYEMQPWWNGDYQPIPLNHHHTHFLLVDNGYRNRFTETGNIADYRAELEKKIKLDAPVVLVVVEGGSSVFMDIKYSLEAGIPVVLCNKTGRAANLMTWAVSSSDQHGNLSQEFEDEMKVKLTKLYGGTWQNENDRTEGINAIFRTIEMALKYKERITIFDITQDEDLDYYILLALFNDPNLKKKKTECLELAISLNRPDLAENVLFRENRNWSEETLHAALKDCIQRNLDGFVKLLLHQENVNIAEFLKQDVLEELYKGTIESEPFWYCVLKGRLFSLKSSSRPQKLTVVVPKIRKVLEKLLDSCDSKVYRTSRANGEVENPYLQLFIWAVLNEKKNLAIIFWGRAEAPIATALLGCWLYHKMSSYPGSANPDWVARLQQDKGVMEKLASNSLIELASRYPIQASEYVTKDRPLWRDITCLQMATAGDAKNFLSTPVCQSAMKKEWMGDVRMPLFKMLFCIPLFVFLPFLVHQVGSFSSRVDSKTCWVKIKKFFTSPRVKFVNYMFSYMAFLALYTYMVLFDFKKKVSWTEIICGIWIFSILMDEIHRNMCVPALSKKSLLFLWRGFLYVVYIGAVLAALFALVYHAISGSPRLPKDIYSVTCVLFLLRILRFYTTSQHLGPKLHIIRSTLPHLLFFGLITLVFLLAYGIPSQALMYDKRKADWSVLKEMFYLPYWQIYGELGLENIEADEECLAEARKEQFNSSGNTSQLDMFDGSICRQYSRLVPILLAVYLFFANVLLLNLIIAIFTKIIETVQSNSITIWKYQMYFLIKEYKVKSVLPTPFSLVEDVIRICWHLFGQCCDWFDREKKYLTTEETRHLRWVERQVIDRYLRKRKDYRDDFQDLQTGIIIKRIDALHYSLLSDLHIGQRKPRNTVSMTPSPALTPEFGRRRAYDRLSQMLHNQVSERRARQVVSTEIQPDKVNAPKITFRKAGNEMDMTDGGGDSEIDGGSESDCFLPHSDVE